MLVAVINGGTMRAAMRRPPASCGPRWRKNIALIRSSPFFKNKVSVAEIAP